CCPENLEMLHEDQNFFHCLVTGDDAWIYHRDPKWSQSGGSKELFRLEFMPHKTTITRESYANTLIALRKSIKKKRQGKLTAVVVLLHANVPVHMSHQSQAAIKKCGFQQLNHPLCSPDGAPSIYFLFQVLKKSIHVQNRQL
ncbi:hypothetical protein XELAEV_18030123mg, partial [Xenopus laevis]